MTGLETGIVPLLCGAIAGYALAWVLLVRGKSGSGRRAWGAAWVLNLALFVVNWVVVGEPPFGNMYHVQVFLALCFLPLFALLSVRHGLGWSGAYFAFTSALPLVGALCMDKEVTWRRMPALQSPWFVPHVTAYMISYSLAAVAFVLLAVKWVRRGMHRDGNSACYEAATHEILRLAFPFMTFGMLSGALWAEEAWGVYWSWDPKETWSLITWGLYAIFLHCCADVRLRRHADLAHALAFLALLTTFFLVNLLPKLASALHSYA